MGAFQGLKNQFYIIQLSNDQIGPDVMHRVDYDYKVSMQLYEDLSREINGSEVYIDLGNGSLFVPSLDNSNLCESRIRFVNEFMEQHYRGIFMGSYMQYVTAFFTKRWIVNAYEESGNICNDWTLVH